MKNALVGSERAVSQHRWCSNTVGLKDRLECISIKQYRKFYEPLTLAVSTIYMVLHACFMTNFMVLHACFMTIYKLLHCFIPCDYNLEAVICGTLPKGCTGRNMLISLSLVPHAPLGVQIQGLVGSIAVGSIGAHLA